MNTRPGAVELALNATMAVRRLTIAAHESSVDRDPRMSQAIDDVADTVHALADYIANL